MHLFEPNDDTILRACKEIGISREQLRQDVELIREWLIQQPHLPAIEESLLIENMLLRCKGSVQATKKALDFNLSMRAPASVFFANRDLLTDEMQGVARNWPSATLSQLTSEGYRTKIYLLGKKESLDQFGIPSVVKRWLIESDICLKDDVSLGEVHIHDLRNLSLHHIRQLTPMLLQQGYQCGVNGYKSRLKGVHLLNAPPLVDTLLTLMKAVVPKKLAARFKVHPDLESLHKCVDREILPKDYGGDQKPLLELAGDWLKKMENYRGWLLEQERNGRVDESKRPADSVNSSCEFFGTEGTFKKLQID